MDRRVKKIEGQEKKSDENPETKFLGIGDDNAPFLTANSKEDKVNKDEDDDQWVIIDESNLFMI